MKGASADDSVKSIRSDMSNKKTKIGPNHHFFDVLRKYQSSENIRNRLNIFYPRLIRSASANQYVRSALVRSFFEPELLLQLLRDLLLVYKIRPHEQ